MSKRVSNKRGHRHQQSMRSRRGRLKYRSVMGEAQLREKRKRPGRLLTQAAAQIRAHDAETRRRLRERAQ